MAMKFLAPGVVGCDKAFKNTEDSREEVYHVPYCDLISTQNKPLFLRFYDYRLDNPTVNSCNSTTSTSVSDLGEARKQQSYPLPTWVTTVHGESAGRGGDSSNGRAASGGDQQITAGRSAP